MTKQKKFDGLSGREAAAKHAELVKELVKFRVSMDPSVIQSSSNASVPALLRDIKALGRKASAKAISSK